MTSLFESVEKIVITPQLKTLIESEVQAVLNTEHRSSEKRNINTHEDRLQFACPYCGDSYADATKKRGNIWWDTLYFHCYNCNKHKSLVKFLSDFNRYFTDSNHFTVLKYIKENQSEIAAVDSLDIEMFKNINDLAISKEDFFTKFDYYPINEKTYRAYPYLKSRLLHHKLNNFAYNPTKKLLAIFNLNHNGNKILGFQTRNLDSTKTTRSKYLSYDISKLRDLMGLELIAKDRDRLDKLSLIFGILSIDLTKDFTMFEGPIDSMFLSNSLSLTGVGKEPFDFDELPTVKYFFDNDKAGKEKMIQKIKKNKRVFLWDKYLRDNFLINRKIKDLNDLIKIAYFEKKPILKNLNDYFSDNPLDIVFM